LASKESNKDYIRGDKKFWIIGSAIALGGAGGVRLVSAFFKGTSLFIPLYALGVVVAIAGLALITRGIDKKREGFRYCPHCMSLNASDAETCRKCKKTMPPVNPKKKSLPLAQEDETQIHPDSR